MIKEAYVSFEVAKLLKEKGFNELCNRVYEGPNLKYTTLPISPLMSLGELGGFHPKQLYVTNSELGDIVYTAPTHQMAMAWLREMHNIAINIGWGEIFEDKFQWWCIILNQKDGNILRESEYYSTYEEAVEAALKYVLKNLI